MAEAPLGALDLGSGTVKWSAFERRDGAWRAVALDEANTELRKGMGPEWTLKQGPIADTLAACAEFAERARALGVARLPAYGTSALRKATNPGALLGPLADLGIEAVVLDEEQEGRLNLLGALARLPENAAGNPARGHAGLLVADPGGDSTELCADPAGAGWERAPVASLPFGSVSLQERFGSDRDNQPLDWALILQVAEAAAGAVRGFGPARPFIGAGLLPSIRMNLPIQRALEAANGLPASAHGEGGPYPIAQLEALARAAAGLDHAGRSRLLEGEPLGKVDRTCYGFASWMGLLSALGAERFTVEPWGIKLGAVLHLNPTRTSWNHG